MYKIYYQDQFRNRFKKINRNSKTQARKIAGLIYDMSKNPFQHTLQTHKIKTTQVQNIYTSKVNRDLILVWKFEDKNNKVSLITIRET